MVVWAPRTTVAAIVERDGEFLMVEEQADGERVLNQPAGHLDNGESLREAVIREVLEETAWTFEPRGLVGIYKWRVPKNGLTYLRYCFYGDVSGHDPGRPLDAEIMEARWMSGDAIAAESNRHRSPMVGRCLNDYRNAKHFPLELIHEID